MYIFQKIFCLYIKLYIKYIYLKYKLYEYIYRYVNIFFSKYILYVYVFINIYRTLTFIMQTKNFILYAINHYSSFDSTSFDVFGYFQLNRDEREKPTKKLTSQRWILKKNWSYL